MNLSLAENIRLATQYLNPKEVDAVVYHSPCNDGSGAAVAAWLALSDSAIYIRRMYHHEFAVEQVRAKNVVVLDASFSEEELSNLRAIAKRVMIIDHHDSAMQKLANTPGCFFTMEHSGAVLSWHYFHGVETKAPELLSLIEDRDLWRWAHRDLSEPLYYALRERCSNSDFKSYLPYIDPKKLQELIVFGKTLVEENHKWCEKTAQTVQTKTFALPNDPMTYKVMCAELTTDRLVSELSEYLYSRHDIDFVMLWCKTSDGRFKVSFRSKHIDVGAIATALGGGGHKKAAGAVLNSSPWQLTV